VPTIAYLSQGQLLWLTAGAAPREITSAFARDFEDRQARQQQIHGWKERGGVWGNMGMAPPEWSQWNQNEVRKPIRFRAVDRGVAPWRLGYLVDFGHMTGLFQYDPDQDQERRLFHRNDFPAEDLNRHPRHGNLALSVSRADATKHIVVCDAEGRLPREVTTGDTIDESPRWVDDDGKRLVYQSSSLLRDEQGFALGLSPYTIQRLDLDAQSIDCLLDSERHDLLQPRLLADGTLLFVRRPYQALKKPHSGWTDLQDIVFFPFRVARAMFYFLNFFSMMFSGKPLRTAGGPQRPTGPDPQLLSLWGQMVDTRRKLFDRQPADDRGLVPKEWELVRRTPHGDEAILARGVLTYDISPSGEIVYTDGKRIWALAPNGDPIELGRDRFIERVLVVPDQNGATV
jgi:hypothetical protein